MDMRRIAALCLMTTALLDGPASAAPAAAEQPVAGAQPLPAQADLKPNTAITGPVLTFDWPALQIGVGSYEDGPTGVTVFRFPDRANAVVDVRGGAPGTVNTDLIRLGYEVKNVDAIVLSGGSAYGEEAITGIQTGLKDLNGPGHIGIVPGAIINDLTHHRLNWYYPDRKLAREVLGALRPGVFPLGAQGAGRSAQQGYYFGCGNHGGQGGAFRQIGDVKIAVFTVVNALGTVVDRAGKLVKCHRNPLWKDDEGVHELMLRAGTGTLRTPDPIPDPEEEAAYQPGRLTRATTISLVVTNRKLSAANLQRLAAQVHTSMARGIQPFSSIADGDTLFAASTQEVDVSEKALSSLDMNIIASELMWDAILAGMPKEPAPTPIESDLVVPAERLRRYAGRYDFGAASPIDILVAGDALTIGSRKVAFHDIPRGLAAAMRPVTIDEFRVPGRYGTRIRFTTNKRGEVIGAVINPGPWAQRGVRLK
jgi:L-aminopeptidase/D-esterase-like protein